MKFERKKIAVALAYALGGTALVAGTAALAQTYTVTGSGIPRAEVEGALPVQTITKEDIATLGVTSVEELIATVSAISSQNATQLPTGAAQLDLRLLRRVAARPGQLPHAGADQRPTRRPVLQRHRHGRRQHQQHSVGGHRARRSAEGRRVRDLRRGCHRRRDQLHPDQQLPGRRGQHVCVDAHAERRRTDLPAERGGGLRRLRQGSLQHRR